jgi:NTE family protein
MSEASPASALLDEEESRGPRPGIALCLSGGGYRAMVFHTGALLRLNDAGLLPKLSRVTSVSGGSITAAILALNWARLQFDANGVAQRLDLVLDAVRRFARVTVDVGAIGWGVILPGSVNDRVVKAYDQHLFRGATLQDLPAEGQGTPRFILLATNVQTGALWRFSRPYMGDYRVGLVQNPRVSLARAVAASSAFPPVLSPASLEIHDAYTATRGADLQRPPYTTDVVLSDGGVYDNLGLEPATKTCGTVLVSDGGMKMAPQERPKRNWAEHAIRVMEVIDNQVRSLRKRHLVDAYLRGDLTGTYWGIATHAADYKLAAKGRPDPLGVLGRDPSSLAQVPTRLELMPDDVQERLMNWGYAVCDTALRAHWGQDLEQQYGVKIADPGRFPFPRGY